MSDQTFQAPPLEHLRALLPQYGIEHYINKGSMGAVYKGRQLALDRDVAIKVLFYEFGADEKFRESFITEAKAMARLKHPNLLGVFDFGEIAGIPYTVMEYVRGESLHDAAWQQVIDSVQASRIVIGICNGLAFAHDQNIVHRDIKPANILLTMDAEPKLTDFVLSHASDSEKSGLVRGTPGYIAPEVFLDHNSDGLLADIYSVGVVLHQLLTGLDPEGSTGPPTHPTGKPALDAIWFRATHIIPSLRYSNIRELANDLENWIAEYQGQKMLLAPTSTTPSNPIKRTLQLTQSVQLKAPAAIAGAAFNPVKRSLQVTQPVYLKAPAAIASAAYNPVKRSLQLTQSVQLKAPAAIAAAPYNPVKRSLQSPQQGLQRSPAYSGASLRGTTKRTLSTPKYPSSNETSLAFKLFIIISLGVIIVFAYQIFQKRKEETKNGVTESSNTRADTNPKRR